MPPTCFFSRSIFAHWVERRNPARWEQCSLPHSMCQQTTSVPRVPLIPPMETPCHPITHHVYHSVCTKQDETSQSHQRLNDDQITICTCCNLPHWINSCNQLFHIQWRNKSLQLIVEIGEHIPCDSDSHVAVFHNLISCHDVVHQ